jgi:murein DD-endopeptidase MepM/ murein hydrolase activator NlpD
MQKNDKFYTFLFSISFRSKNQNNLTEVRVSKRLIDGFVITLFLLVGFSALGLGINGVLTKTGFNGFENEGGIVAQVSGQIPGNDTIDYSRPAESVNYMLNSGGPVTPDSLNGENTELANQLRIIRSTSDPSFLPSIWAHPGKINNEFGFRRNPFGGRTYEFHPGMDIDGERGEIVVAPANGTVIKAGWQGGYGNMVEIDHGNGLTSRYGHLSKIDVEVGDPISREQLIGYIGSTGRSTGPHLHYEIRLNDRPINPRHFLPPEPTELSKPLN